MNDFGFVRVAVVSPELRIADVRFNLQRIKDALTQAENAGVQIVVFPELCITGYTCADLFYQEKLQEESLVGLQEIALLTKSLSLIAIVGFPATVDGRIYNCAALVSDGSVLGVVPKSYLPTTKEYYEERWFTSGRNVRNKSIYVANEEIPFGIDLIFKSKKYPTCIIGIEICEDLWAIQPPSGGLAIAGATLIANISASNELLGKAEYRRDLIRQQSARCMVAYLYAGAGPGESTTDTVFGGHSMIVENGVVLAETERFHFETQIAIADVDLDQLKNERIVNSCYSSDASYHDYREIYFVLPDTTVTINTSDDLKRKISRQPFVPYERLERARHCEEIFAIQSTGLAKRLRHTGISKTIIGVSGGLDSTLALLVTIRAFDLLKLTRTGIIAVMMPGFGSSERTRNNSENLISMLEITSLIIPIESSVLKHFEDINHDKNQHDITYENSQARERTQILMDLSNKYEGLVVGTGDLSELALGWCTYNGDHMSMYHVNAGVPKTLVKSMVEWCADEYYDGGISAVLNDICNTPITPELLPLAEDGSHKQITEELIGPYELHDFYLFHVIRHKFPPKKVIFLAGIAFAEIYTPDEIRKWLNIFYQRFFSQQFKRSAMPDGPKIGTVALSPRGDWRMPSDASPESWIN